MLTFVTDLLEYYTYIKNTCKHTHVHMNRHNVPKHLYQTTLHIGHMYTPTTAQHTSTQYMYIFTHPHTHSSWHLVKAAGGLHKYTIGNPFLNTILSAICFVMLLPLAKYSLHYCRCSVSLLPLDCSTKLKLWRYKCRSI